MKVLTRAIAAAAVAGSCAIGTAGVAAAAPASHGPRASIPISCANGVNGMTVLRRSTSHKMRWFVLHVTGGTKKQKVLVPTAIDVTFTFTSSSGKSTTNTENITKKSHAKKQTSCTINGTAPVDGGTLAADGTITGAFH
jgi:hypothetical protein